MNLSKAQSFTVSSEEAGIRLDRWFHRHVPHLTQAALQKALRRGDIVSTAPLSAGTRLEDGQSLLVFEGLLVAPPVVDKPFSRQRAQAAEQWLETAVLYRGKGFFVLNKPRGWATQGGSGETCPLDRLLSHWCAEKGFPGKPHLVHRLDKETSGALLIALSPTVAAYFGAHFRERQITKIYWALCHDNGLLDVGHKGLWSSLKEPQEAHTFFHVRGRGEGTLWLEVTLLTGRKHQIRRHCAEAGIPILGDRVYGLWSDEGPLQLHARALSFEDPDGELCAVQAPPPQDMEDWIAGQRR